MENLEEVLNPPGRQDEFTAWLRGEACYLGAQRLPDGSYAALVRLITTAAIALDVDQWGWGRRFCYRDMSECLAAWAALTSRHDEPTGWIARRPE